MARDERPDPQFFATPEELRAWFADHHQTDSELMLGYWKKGSGRPSVTWAEAVREALCVGWIDSVAGGIDDDSYCQRFTPRKARSTWSNINIKAFGELLAAGRVLPAGQAAFDARTADNSGIYSHEAEQEPELDADQQAAFEAEAEAWAWFGTQAPSYRKSAIHWVTSAKKPETRQRRLAQLIADSAAEQRLAHLSRRPKR